MYSKLFNCLVMIAAISLFGAFFGCTEDAQPDVSSATDKPVILVVNYPLQYFAERIAGDLVDVRFPAPPDEDPAFWQPSDDVIAEYQSADLILLNGASYAKWTETASLPTSRIVDTSAGFRDKLIQGEESVAHSHGPGGEHAHTGTAFTTWLDFEQAGQQAAAVKGSLVDLIPNHADQLDENFAALKQDLAALDSSMQKTAKKLGDQPLVTSHPVYQYLARRYSLNIKTVHWEPDVVPTENDLSHLKELLTEHPAKWMIWEGQPDPRSVKILESMDVSSAVLDPYGGSQADQELDWLAVMRRNIENLSQVFDINSVR